MTAGQPLFFLHGGPGLSAAPERLCQPDAGHVHWWDQPRPNPGQGQPLAALLAAAEEELLRHAQAQGGKLTLVGSSYGAQLACHMVRRRPALVARMVLLAPTVDPHRSTVRLAERVARSSAGSDGGLASALQAYRRAPERGRYWQLFQALMGHPDTVSHYLSPGAAERAPWLAGQLAQPEVFDVVAHMAIMDDLAQRPALSSDSAYRGPVSIVFGSHDPLTDMALEPAYWRGRFPQATLRTVDSGHFPLLELPLAQCIACITCITQAAAQA